MDNLTPEQIQQIVEENTSLKAYKQETTPYMEHLVANEKLLNAIAEKTLDDSAVDRLFAAPAQQEVTKPDAQAQQVAQAASQVLTKEDIEKMIDEKAATLVETRLERESEISRILSTDLAAYAEDAAALLDQYPNLENVDMEKVFLMAKAIKDKDTTSQAAAAAMAEQERQKLASVAGGNGNSSGAGRAYNPFGGFSTTSGIN